MPHRSVIHWTRKSRPLGRVDVILQDPLGNTTHGVNGLRGPRVVVSGGRIEPASRRRLELATIGITLATERLSPRDKVTLFRAC